MKLPVRTDKISLVFCKNIGLYGEKFIFCGESLVSAKSLCYSKQDGWYCGTPQTAPDVFSFFRHSLYCEGASGTDAQGIAAGITRRWFV